MKEEILKECKRHGLTEHSFYSKRLRCKKCLIEYDYNKRHRIKSLLVEYKGSKCVMCGYNKCLNALEFHHINPIDKSFALNTANYNKSLKHLKKEADKCILLCANCHREIHYKENENRREEILFEVNNKETALSLLKLEEIKKDIDDGLRQNDISKKYNISLSSVKRFYKKHNLNKKHFKCDLDVFLEIFKENPTYAYMSKTFQISNKVVRKFCVDNCLIKQMNEIRKEKGFKPLVDKHMYI